MPDNFSAVDSDFRAIGELFYRLSLAKSNPYLRDALGFDERFEERLQNLVETVLGGLSSRQRRIVERCDFGGGARAAVAAELGISVRQFSRERAEAHDHIRRTLATLTVSTKHARATTPAPVDQQDALEPAILMSRILEENGQWELATSMLERLANDLDAPDQRITVELRLSRVFADSEHYALARYHLKIAQTLADRLEPHQRWRALEVDMMSAHILAYSGFSPEASTLLQRGLTQLRSWKEGHHENHVKATIAKALILHAQLQSGQRTVQTSMRELHEALAIAEELPNTEARNDIQLAARIYSARLSFSHRLNDGGKEELARCYREALSRGLTATALLIGSYLAESCHITDEPEAAIDFLTPLLSVARALDIRMPLTFILYRLAESKADIGRYEDSLSYLQEFMHLTSSDPFRQSFARLMASRVHFGLKNYQEALDAAEAAERLFFAISSRDSWVGLALTRQAQALVALGRTEHAQRTLISAIDLLAQVFPADRLRAYDLMAQISGERKYAQEARKLRRAIKESR
jgi:tetratricopeptide (TPR) repeat protein